MGKSHYIRETTTFLANLLSNKAGKRKALLSIKKFNFLQSDILAPNRSYLGSSKRTQGIGKEIKNIINLNPSQGSPFNDVHPEKMLDIPLRGVSNNALIELNQDTRFSGGTEMLSNRLDNL